MRRLGVVFAALLVAACAGKDGATGPTGPQGATGPQGPAGLQGLPGPAGTNGSGTVYRVTVLVNSSGSATAVLPAAAGTDINKPPVMSCYVGSATSAVWLAVAGSASTSVTYCGFVFSGGVFNAVMNAAPVGWIAAFVVVY